MTTDLEQLPTVLQDIVYDYKNQLEHFEKYKHVLNTIKDMNKYFEKESTPDSHYHTDSFGCFYLILYLSPHFVRWDYSNDPDHNRYRYMFQIKN